MKIVIDGYLEYDSHANDYMIEWISILDINGNDQLDRIKSFIQYERKRAIITIDIIDTKE